MANGIKRTITHWTGGGGRANALDKKHYHRITEHDGTIVEGNEEIEDNIVTADDDYAAHTLNLNKGSAGFSMAGMLDAKEDPLDYGPAPINEKQFEAHCKMLAEFHLSYGIPVTRETCLTHAEVEPTLGVKQKQKWDITRLNFKPNLRGALPVGDYLRERVRSYMPTQPTTLMQPLILKRGMRGAFVLDLQVKLQGLNYFSGKLDGDFGAYTESAVMMFQGQNDLAQDGQVGPVTRAKLDGYANPAPQRVSSEAILREKGSTVILGSDTVQKATVAGGVLASAGAAVQTVTNTITEATGTAQGAASAIVGAQTVLGPLLRLLAIWWPVLVIGVVGFVVWQATKRIKKARVDDAVSGANLRL